MRRAQDYHRVESPERNEDTRWFFKDDPDINYTRITNIDIPQIDDDPIKINKTYQSNEFHTISSTNFQLRSKDYGVTKNKEASKDMMYEPIQSIHFDLPKRYVDIEDLLNVEEMSATAAELPAAVKIPQFIVINCICPIYEPALIWSSGEERYVMGIMVAEIAPETKRRWMQGKTCEADHLFERWISEDVKSAPMKCISRMANFNDQLGFAFNAMARSYNGKPYLIKQAESKLHDNWASITIDLSKFSMLFKQSIWIARTTIEMCIVDHCLMIEGNRDDNDELPERAICSWRFSRVDYFRLGNLSQNSKPRIRTSTCAPIICGSVEND